MVLSRQVGSKTHRELRPEMTAFEVCVGHQAELVAC